MTAKDFMKKTVAPVVAAIVLFTLLYPFCVDNNICDYRKLWMLSGIPFGVHRMYFWLIPRGFDIGGTVGMLIFNLLIGGLIGSVILGWRLLVAAFYLVKGTALGIAWFTGKVAGR